MPAKRRPSELARKPPLTSAATCRENTARYDAQCKHGRHCPSGPVHTAAAKCWRDTATTAPATTASAPPCWPAKRHCDSYHDDPPTGPTKYGRRESWRQHSSLDVRKCCRPMTPVRHWAQQPGRDTTPHAAHRAGEGGGGGGGCVGATPGMPAL